MFYQNLLSHTFSSNIHILIFKNAHFRRVFGYSMLAASLLTLLTPAAAYISHVAVITLRVLLGFFLGATWPAILPLAARWIPPMDRSKFMSNMMGE